MTHRENGERKRETYDQSRVDTANSSVQTAVGAHRERHGRGRVFSS